MSEFPRTMVGGISMPRLLIGTNWMLGYSHTSLAKDRFIRDYQTHDRMVAMLTVFLERGVNAIMAPLNANLNEAIMDAEQATGVEMIRIFTPSFNISPGGSPEEEPEVVLDEAAKMGATFCLPHQCVTDALIDRREGVIRDIDIYTAMIRERGMIPGLSTHMPEAVVYADKQDADVATYIQLYNASNFLLQVEADWVMQIIQEAKHPVMTIKPLAAGKLLPVVGLTFVWRTIRDIDMVTIGTTTPDEAREVMDISLDLIENRLPKTHLQKTRSKASLTY